MHITSRAYEGKADYRRVRDFLIETYGMTKTHHNWCIERWDWWRHFGDARAGLDGSRQWEADVRLWETEAGELVGVANREDPGAAFLQIHPRCRQLEDEMVVWAERQLTIPIEDGRRRRLEFSVYDYDTERQAMLARRGYQQLERGGYKRRRSMDKPVPEVEVPDGYAVRALSAAADLALRCTVLAEAFGASAVGTDVYRFLQTALGYRQDLDIVAVGPDGTFASFCQAWFDDVNRIGMLEPVGTHPAHRRLGLGKAVVSEALRRLQALGATVVYVGSGDDDPPNRLYESVGFTEFDVEHVWRKVF
ncbi:MAG: GNAT family N-acetyltransferase [Chloroflexi bacterium]|nr:GNAT family N-acetyltransferase [Chloroflexota bacterium]